MTGEEEVNERKNEKVKNLSSCVAGVPPRVFCRVCVHSLDKSSTPDELG
jgi:hypothetical protein